MNSSILAIVVRILCVLHAAIAVPQFSSIAGAQPFYYGNETYNMTSSMTVITNAIARDAYISSFGRLFHKLNAGEHVAVMLLGGSFTEGTACDRNNRSFTHDCRWAYRLVQWMNEVYDGEVELISKSTSATISFYGYDVMVRESQPFDLLLVDYSINDQFLAESDRSTSLQMVTEMIVRTAFERNAAVLYISEAFMNPSLEDLYNSVLQHYGVPLLSYSNVITPDLNAFVPQPTLPHPPQWYGKSKYVTHPSYPTHILLAQTVAYFLTAIGARIPSEVPTPRPLPQHIFANTSKSENAFCSPALTSLSSIDSDSSALTPFVPYQVKGRHVDYYQGWEYVRDMPGKPLGWVSNSSMNASATTRLVFEVTLAQGEVSITYLETYRNAGRLEVWLSLHDIWARHGILENAQGVLGCCDRAKARRDASYPVQLSRTPSYSGYIDTFNSNNSVSAVVTKTLRFSYRGTFLLNVRHDPISAEEVRVRGGDKVKLLGIRAC